MKTVPASPQKWVPGNNRHINLWFHVLSQILLKYYFILIIWTFNSNFQLQLFHFFFKYIYLFYSLLHSDRSQLQVILLRQHQKEFVVHLTTYRALDAQPVMSGDLTPLYKVLRAAAHLCSPHLPLTEDDNPDLFQNWVKSYRSQPST